MLGPLLVFAARRITSRGWLSRRCLLPVGRERHGLEGGVGAVIGCAGRVQLLAMHGSSTKCIQGRHIQPCFYLLKYRHLLHAYNAHQLGRATGRHAPIALLGCLLGCSRRSLCAPAPHGSEPAPTRVHARWVCASPSLVSQPPWSAQPRALTSTAACPCGACRHRQGSARQGRGVHQGRQVMTRWRHGMGAVAAGRRFKLCRACSRLLLRRDACWREGGRSPACMSRMHGMQ